jgi:hypothetical protein
VSKKHAPRVAFFSVPVRDVPNRSCDPADAWWSPRKGNNFGQKKSTHREFSVGNRLCFFGQTRLSDRISRRVLTFFDRNYFLFWEATMRPRGHKTALGHLSQGLRKKPLLGPVFLTPRRSACVKPVRMRVCTQIYPLWPPVNGNNFRQKKLTHTEVLDVSQKTPVSFSV